MVFDNMRVGKIPKRNKKKRKAQRCGWWGVVFALSYYATIEIVSDRNQISSVDQICSAVAIPTWLLLVGMFWLSRHSLECEKEGRFLFSLLEKKSSGEQTPEYPLGCLKQSNL